MIKLYNLKLTQTDTDRHDSTGTYSKLLLKDLQYQVPEFDWQLYFKTILEFKVSDKEPIVSYAMAYFTQMGQLLYNTDRRYLKQFLEQMLENNYIIL